MNWHKRGLAFTSNSGHRFLRAWVDGVRKGELDLGSNLEAGRDAQVTGFLQKSAFAFQKQRLVELR